MVGLPNIFVVCRLIKLASNLTRPCLGIVGWNDWVFNDPTTCIHPCHPKARLIRRHIKQLRLNDRLAGAWDFRKAHRLKLFLTHRAKQLGSQDAIALVQDHLLSQRATDAGPIGDWRECLRPLLHSLIKSLLRLLRDLAERYLLNQGICPHHIEVSICPRPSHIHPIDRATALTCTTSLCCQGRDAPGS